MPSISEESSSGEVKNIEQLLSEVLESSSQETDFTDLIKEFTDLYESHNNNGFEKNFKKLLKVVLSESQRSVEVKRILTFIADCAVTLDNKYKSANIHESMEEDEEIMHPLLKHLIRLLEKWSNVSSFTVRFRSCQLLFLLLTYIQDYGIGEIDMTTYETISRVIESRKLDVSCNVRAHAVLLAKFFQDPSVVEDPVIAGLCWQLQHDPNPKVRQNIVNIIAACEETIIPITKRFLYDKNASVRNEALLHICNRITPHSFTTAQRVLILKQCFSDPSPVVRRTAEQRLIPVWFRAYKDNLCKFFKALQIGQESLDNLDFLNSLFTVLAKEIKVTKVFEEIDLDTETYLPKSALTGEKIFLWRHFYKLAQKNDKLLQFLPETEELIDILLKEFSNPCEGDQTWILNELLLFLMDIMDATCVERCAKIFPVVINLMKNPYIPSCVMPYAVPLYLNYCPKDKDQVHFDILEVIEDMQKIMQLLPIGEEKDVLVKCFSVAKQTLLVENLLTSGIRSLKDKLITHHLNSEDADLKMHAIACLALYCELDLQEATTSWPLFSNGMFVAPSPLRCLLLKGAFDILKCHGWQIFSDLNSNGEEAFHEALKNMLSHSEDDESDRTIIVQGILKLYLAHHTSSPSILSQLVLLHFHPDQYHLTKKDIENFLKLYAQNEEEANCLSKALLSTIDILFDSNNNSPYHRVNIKSVALQLLEFIQQHEHLKISIGESFKDSLMLKLTKNFLKKPWRLSAAELYTICGSYMPTKVEILLKLKEHIKLIIECLQSAITRQKNPHSKQSIKQFTSYLKKLKTAVEKAPVTPKNTTQNNNSYREVQGISSTEKNPENPAISPVIFSEAPVTPKNTTQRNSYRQMQGISSTEKDPEVPEISPVVFSSPDISPNISIDS